MAQDTEHAIFLEVTLTPDEALALAEFLKRVQPEDWERRAGDREEAWLMRDAGIALQAALRRKGFSPR